MIDILRKYFSIGLGDLAYTEPSPQQAGALLGANNGLSKSTLTPNTAVLGQDQGQAGNPAQLLSNRDIPLNGFMVQMLQTLGTDFLQFLQGQILIDGTSGAGVVPTFGMNDQTGPDQFLITLDSAGIHFQFGGGVFMTWSLTGGFVWSGPGVESRQNFTGGFGGPMPTFIAPSGPSANPPGMGAVIDTSGAAEVFSLDPVAMANRIFWVKKKGTDVNSITINASSGLIFGDSGGVASFVFNGPGQSICLTADGTNFFII